MNTLNLFTLQAFQRFSLAYKIQFLKTCPKEFFRSLSECIVNLLQGNSSDVKKSHVLKYKEENKKRTTWKQRRSLLSSQKGLMLKNNFAFRPEMEQFALVPNRSTTEETTQYLSQSKNHSNTNLSKLPRTTNGRSKTEINQQLSTSASPLVNKL